MSLEPIKFAEQHVDPILHGEKYVTVRLAGEIDAADRPGQIVELVNAKTGQPFAIAEVDIVVDCDAEWFAGAGIKGHRQYADVDEFLDELADYYPDAELSPETRLQTLHFTNVRDVNAVRADGGATDAR